MVNYFILHGTNSSPYSNWFEWLHNKIAKKGFACFCPHFPTVIEQTYDAWEAVLLSYYKLGFIKENSVFVCHDIAAIFLIKFCIKQNIKIGKLISVAGYNNAVTNSKEQDVINQSFFVKDIDKFLSLCEERVCLYSDNDNYVQLENLKEFTESLKAEHVLLKKCGHLDSESGIKELTAIELYLKLPNYDEQSF